MLLTSDDTRHLVVVAFSIKKVITCLTPMLNLTFDTKCYTQHKKASNHHANLPLEMYSFTL